jgi:hypothetical protein
VTIAAGFCSQSAIVLAADTEETTGSVKVTKQKIVWKPEAMRIGFDQAHAVFAGAGDAVFADMVADELWETINKSGITYRDILSGIKDRVLELHEKYGKFSTSDVSYEIDMLVALWVANGPSIHLLRLLGPAVASVREYACIGVGLELGNYIADRMYYRYKSTAEMELIAIYLLQQVKKYVPLCGGQSHILTFGIDGFPKWMEGWRVSQLTSFMSKFETAIGEAMLTFADLETQPRQLEAATAALTVQLPEMRQSLQASIASWEKLLEEMNKP